MSAPCCPFCSLPPERIVGQKDFGIWIYDGLPVSAGHSLIIPKRHVGSFFEVSSAERAGMLELLDQAKAAVDVARRPNGYNIGINDGAAAGQTVPHLHIHLIPRFLGDVADPRGGVRWVIPRKRITSLDARSSPGSRCHFRKLKCSFIQSCSDCSSKGGAATYKAGRPCVVVELSIAWR